MTYSPRLKRSSDDQTIDAENVGKYTSPRTEPLILNANADR